MVSFVSAGAVSGRTAEQRGKMCAEERREAAVFMNITLNMKSQNFTLFSPVCFSTRDVKIALKVAPIRHYNSTATIKMSPHFVRLVECPLVSFLTVLNSVQSEHKNRE